MYVVNTLYTDLPTSTLFLKQKLCDCVLWKVAVRWFRHCITSIISTDDDDILLAEV